MIEIFEDIQLRNVYSSIINFLSYEDINNLRCINKKTKENFRKVYLLPENRKMFKTIYNKRFFDKKHGNVFEFNEIIGPFCSFCTSKQFWQHYFPLIDDGDMVKYMNQYVQIKSNPSSSNYFFVRHIFDEREAFPLTYWEKHFAKIDQWKVWIHINVYYDSLKYWNDYKLQPRIKFMGFDLSPENYDPGELIPVSVNYSDGFIYLYYTGY